MDIGYLAGWVGLGFGSLVAPPQLYRMIKTGRSRDVSLTTYIFLFIMMSGYLVHALYISAPVFIAAQIWGLIINGAILAILVKRKLKYG
ncbi:hypothetical protein LCGC14_0861440 [marine sediment metagenome]|uniref:PQ-loop repeat-containing protein n=1 Tax=marine sediment metagenome TaxID=412755 RepID=A0A0F9P751_9ZZZZ